MRLIPMWPWLASACLCSVACGGPGSEPKATPTTGPVCNGANVFLTQCTGGVCHAGRKPARGLDLLSPDPATRLVGIPSTCAGRLLVDPTDPSRSFLLEKISSSTPECGGSRMPLSGVPLPPDVIACVKDWVTTVTP